MFTLRDVQTQTHCLPALISPRMTCSCAFARSYRLSCCDMDQSGTLWTEPPWTCRCSTGGTDLHSQLPLWKVGATGRSGHPLCFVWGLEKFRPALKSTLNGESYRSTEVRLAKNSPCKETRCIAYKWSISRISQSHLISWSVLRRDGVGTFSIHTCLLWEIWIEKFKLRNLNMHCLILNSFVLLWKLVSPFPLTPATEGVISGIL